MQHAAEDEFQLVNAVTANGHSKVWSQQVLKLVCGLK